MQNVNSVRKGSKNDFDLPLFSYASVSAATNNFSASNKLGEGGFGPVYKVRSHACVESLLTISSKNIFRSNVDGYIYLTD